MQEGPADWSSCFWSHSLVTALIYTSTELRYRGAGPCQATAAFQSMQSTERQNPNKTKSPPVLLPALPPGPSAVPQPHGNVQSPLPLIYLDVCAA